MQGSIFTDFEIRMWTSWGTIILPTTMTLGVFNLSDPQFLHIKSGDNHTSFELNT